MISFRHILDVNNCGDLASGPYLYFDFPEFEIAGYSAPVSPESSAVIYGGGTMNNWLARERRLPDIPKIAWGIGSSRHGAVDPWPDPEDFDLIGVREWSPEREAGGRYLPCVSCMSPLFDEDYPIAHEAVLFTNADFGIKSRYPVAVGGLPAMENAEPIERAIPFLASGETVITNSYHGAVWSTWLGRRVVCLPYSSKFYGLKYPPGYSANGGLDWRTAQPATGYLGGLEDSRALNRAFYERVMAFLGHS